MAFICMRVERGFVLAHAKFSTPRVALTAVIFTISYLKAVRQITPRPSFGSPVTAVYIRRVPLIRPRAVLASPRVVTACHLFYSLFQQTLLMRWLASRAWRAYSSLLYRHWPDSQPVCSGRAALKRQPLPRKSSSQNC